MANLAFAQVRTSPSKALLSRPKNTWTYYYSKAPNLILHWTRNAFINIPDGIDPANNQVITEDHWVKTGSDGLPILVRYKASLPNGDLYQDIFITPETSIVILGPVYAQSYQQTPSANWCVEGANRPTLQIPSAYLPLFASESQLPASGFSRASSLAHPIPNTMDIPGVNPIKNFAPSNNPHTWLFTYPRIQGAVTETLHYDVTDDGLVTSYGTRDIDIKTQAIVQEEWYTQGQLNVFSLTSAIPTWVFQQPLQVTKGCN